MGFKLPGIKGLPTDKWVLSAAAIGLVVLGLSAYLFWSVRGRAAELAEQVEQAQADSVQYEALMTESQRLRARRDSIAERVRVIQEIDQDRYVWAHVMDELARALPDYTWLSGVVQSSPLPNLQIRISGRAGNLFALSRFIEQLEASPFFRNVDVINSELVSQQEEGGEEQQVYDFTLTAAYNQPPLEFLETVPLFEGDVQEEMTAAASDQG